MLRPEDCKPGVEVICINASEQVASPPTLKFGCIYTIKCIINRNILLLNEVPDTDNKITYFGHKLSRFKLIDPKEIQQFYEMIEKPVDKKILEEV